MSRNSIWLVVALLVALTACDGGLRLPEGWQPVGPLDCRAELSVVGVRGGILLPQICHNRHIYKY